MAGTHGNLFSEIGKLVVAAHGGQPIDLTAVSEDLAARYANLGVPADVVARAIARSLGAVGLSLAMIAERQAAGEAGDLVPFEARAGEPKEAPPAEPGVAESVKSASALFPSGVRLAVLS